MTSAISAGIATEVTDANINDFGYNLKGDHNIGEGRSYRFGLGGRQCLVPPWYGNFYGEIALREKSPPARKNTTLANSIMVCIADS